MNRVKLNADQIVRNAVDRILVNAVSHAACAQNRLKVPRHEALVRKHSSLRIFGQNLPNLEIALEKRATESLGHTLNVAASLSPERVMLHGRTRDLKCFECLFPVFISCRRQIGKLRRTQTDVTRNKILRFVRLLNRFFFRKCFRQHRRFPLRRRTATKQKQACRHSRRQSPLEHKEHSFRFRYRAGNAPAPC